MLAVTEDPRAERPYPAARAGIERALLLAPEPGARRFAPELVSAHLPIGTVLRASQAATLDEACSAARDALRTGFRLLIAAGSDALFRAVAGCALGDGSVWVAHLPSTPDGLFARWLGAESADAALSRLRRLEGRAVDTARVNGRAMMLHARLGAVGPAPASEDPCAELLLDGLRVDARLGALSVALQEGEPGGRGLAVTLHRACVDPRLYGPSLAAYAPEVLARHLDGTATWQLRVRRFTARLARPLGLTIDGGSPAPARPGGRELTTVLYAEHLASSLCLVG